jgi:hypothetical protein
MWWQLHTYISTHTNEQSAGLQTNDVIEKGDYSLKNVMKSVDYPYSSHAKLADR